VIAPFFADRETSRRIEAAEADLTLAYGSAVQRRRPGRGAIAVDLAGGAAVFTGEGSPFDKVIGIGYEPIDWPSFDGFERALRSRGAAVQVEVASRADPEIARTLTARGYRLVGFEDVLGRGLDEPPDVANRPDVDVRPVLPHEIDAWIETVVTAQAHPDGPAAHELFARDALERVYRDLAGLDGFRRYLARRDGAVAGGACLRLDGRLAELCGAATLPEHRRRGVQTALTRARLADARRAGCDLATVTTAPGSKSEENAVRQGFAIAYTRAVLRSA